MGFAFGDLSYDVLAYGFLHGGFCGSVDNGHFHQVLDFQFSFANTMDRDIRHVMLS